MMSPEARRRLLLARLHAGAPWMTNAVLCVFGFGLLLLAKQFVQEDFGFRFGFDHVSGASVMLYVAAMILIFTQPTNRATFWIVIGFAIAFRLATVFAEPFLSSDIYRYAWDGMVQHAHVNPYRYVPGDPALSYLRAPNQDLFDNINRRDYAHTIYPPVAQMIYWLVTFFSATVTAMKAAMLVFEGITVGALLVLLRYMGRPRVQILMYAWCPLLVWEIGGAGHVDAAVFALITLAMLFRYREQPVLTGLFLGMAVFTKFYPLVLLPALYKRGDWKMPGMIAAVGVVGYSVYSSVGMKVFGFLSGYAKEEGMDSGARYFLLEWVQRVKGLEHLPVTAYMVFCAIVLGAISVWCWRNATVETLAVLPYDSRSFVHGPPGHRFDPPQGVFERPVPAYMRGATMLGFAMMLLFSPHYAWYIVWLVPLFVLTPNLPVLVYLMAFFYLYTTALADPGPKMFLLNKILYSVVALAMLLHVAVLRRLPAWRRVFP